MHNIQHPVRHTAQHKTPCFRRAYANFARESGFSSVSCGRVRIGFSAKTTAFRTCMWFQFTRSTKNGLAVD